MEEDISEIVKDINTDPRLALLAKAIFELSEKQVVQEMALKTAQIILTDQQSHINLLNESLKKMNDAIDVMINQMFIMSNQANTPSSFKGVYIK